MPDAGAGVRLATATGDTESDPFPKGNRRRFDGASSTVKRWRPLAALAALTLLTACAKSRLVELYPQLGEYAGREIEDVDFRAIEPFSEDTLDALTETEETRCRLLIFPFCFPGTDWGRERHYVNLGTIEQDISRLALLYRRSGYFGTEVVPDIEEVDGDGGPVRVTFDIRRGDPITVDSVVIEGTEGIADPDSLRDEVPLQPGELFDLGHFVASADAVLHALRVRGHAYAEVLRNYGVDTIQDRATAWLVAVPGPSVTIDSVRVEGIETLDRATALRQVTFAQGDLLRRSELQRSQRNLYDLELVQFASVGVAPDSLQVAPEDSSQATVLVQVAEAPEHVVEAAVGYGTVECFRTQARWVDRSFYSGGRRVTLSGSLSRIGVGEPTAWVGSSMCQSAGEQFIDKLDYRLAAELLQPYFLSPGNRVVGTAFVERQSEPELFQRTARGGRVELSRRLADRALLTASLDIEHRETRAVQALYCLQFAVCSAEDVATFAAPRWRNALGATWVRDRSDAIFDPTSGHVLRAGLLWATPLLGSDFDFVRGTSEGATYHRLHPGWIMAGRVRAGTFLTDATLGVEDFVPPEERFFAGGANSVRGFNRNEMGPGVWIYEGELPPDSIDPTDADLDVRYIPSGGTSVAVASAELRFPSPVLRDLLRLAAFVDGGTIGLDPLWKLNSKWQVTPGFGVRATTPVGPLRIDIAYNPYPRQRQPLLARDSLEVLHRVSDAFRPDPPNFLRRLRLHVAVGQAF